MPHGLWCWLPNTFGASQTLDCSELLNQVRLLTQSLGYNTNILFSAMLKCSLSCSMLFTHLYSLRAIYMSKPPLHFCSYCSKDILTPASSTNPFCVPPKKSFMQNLIRLSFEDLLQLWDIFKVRLLLCALEGNIPACLGNPQSDLGIDYPW